MAQNTPLTARDAEGLLAQTEYAGYRIGMVGPKGDHTMMGPSRSSREEKVDVWPIVIVGQKAHVTDTFRRYHPNWWPLFNNFLLLGSNKAIVRYTA